MDNITKITEHKFLYSDSHKIAIEIDVYEGYNRNSVRTTHFDRDGSAISGGFETSVKPSPKIARKEIKEYLNKVFTLILNEAIPD